MTKRDLFRIIIRIYAVYSMILGILYVVPQNLSNITDEHYRQYEGFGVYILILSIVFVIAYSWFLNRKADTIINWFKLDQGYDTEDAPLTQFNTEFIFTMASVIIGGFLIVDYAPLFIVQTYNAFKSTMRTAEWDETLKTEWALTIIRLFVGYLLIKFAPKMHLLVTKKEKEGNDPDSIPK